MVPGGPGQIEDAALRIGDPDRTVSGRHRYVIDFAVPHLRLACEVDGLSAHSTREALDYDLERQNRLVRHGWMVLRFTATHLKKRRRVVRDEIRATVDHLRQSR